jgi:aminoglycoside phosphotransferase (APT) family kinase protein
MSQTKMHADEVNIDASLVKQLLHAQFPQWADLPLAAVPSAGTDNALYRLGDDLVVRLPRVDWALAQIEKERQWLPRLAPHLPLAIPVPLAMGEPGAGYPWPWTVYRWLDGENATADTITDPNQAAVDLAAFLTALQQIDAAGGPPPGYRGQPLALRDAPTREAIAAVAALDRMFDIDGVTAAWESALQAPPWDRAPVWFHGDMLPGNLLFARSRLRAVIDFGMLGVGDPACDSIIAWSLFSGESREVFRSALGVDDATWARSRGWALSISLIILPYYWNTNPVLTGIARHTIAEVLADHTQTT